MSTSTTPHWVRTSTLDIGCLQVGTLANNVYLLIERGTGECVLVDAADDAPAILAMLDGRVPSLIVTTHRHADHWRALAAVVAATGAPTAAGVNDAAGIGVPTVRLLHDGDTLQVGRIPVTVIELVGHSPGSIALHFAGDSDALTHHLISGDALFPGGVGNTWGDATAFQRLLQDVRTKVFDRLPDTTGVYPGHGDVTTVARERPQVDDWEQRGY
ncbi:MAG: MBL fold metallo-hydrolase [Actinomycetales bacterium]|nr:MBL fold metallo-hydrolase [Actinomycetales bacterium]